MEKKAYVHKFFNFLFHFIFWHTACGILVPRPGIEPAPPALEAWSLNHWTSREALKAYINKISVEQHKIICIQGSDWDGCEVHTGLCLCRELDLAWLGSVRRPTWQSPDFAFTFIPTFYLSLWLLGGLCVPSSRLWAESCSTSQCGCRNPLHRSSVELPDDLWVGPESRVPCSPVHRGRRRQHCRSEERRVGKECRSRWSPYH